MTTNKMLNLVIVISGNHGRVSSILEFIANSLNTFFKKGYRVLSEYSLERGEANCKFRLNGMHFPISAA